jgi:hypothetical protein
MQSFEKSSNLNNSYSIVLKSFFMRIENSILSNSLLGQSPSERRSEIISEILTDSNYFLSQ